MIEGVLESLGWIAAAFFESVEDGGEDATGVSAGLGVGAEADFAGDDRGAEVSLGQVVHRVRLHAAVERIILPVIGQAVAVGVLEDLIKVKGNGPFGNLEEHLGEEPQARIGSLGLEVSQEVVSLRLVQPGQGLESRPLNPGVGVGKIPA